MLLQSAAVWEGGAQVGNSFRVDWKRRVDLPFEATQQMFNPLNEGKPVRICRDGQEVPHELGQQLTRMMDRIAQEAGIPPPRAPANPMPAGETAYAWQMSAHTVLMRLMLNICLLFLLMWYHPAGLPGVS